MAYKVFSNGDALTGGELNTYLMNQAVISFATATARDAALPSPSEGQLVWLEDSNKYVYYTGSAWSDLITPASSGNAIINGAFEINQRNFSTGTTSAYGFDRWVNNTDGVGATFSAQTFTPGTAPVAGYEGKNFLQAVTTGQTSTSTFTILGQRIEDVRTFAGQTVTVSFWAKSGSGTPKIGVELNQYFSGGSADVSVPLSAVTLSTSWTRYSATVAVPSLSGKTIGSGNGYLELNLWTSAGSDFNSRASSIGIQSATIAIWGVQVESGSTATAFKRNATNIQGELAACQRYYIRHIAGASGYGKIAQGFALSSNSVAFGFPLPVEMRAVPTAIDYSTIGNWRAYDNVSEKTGSSFSLDTASTTKFVNIELVGVGSATTSRPYFLRAFNDTAAYLGFSAEL